MDLSWLRRPELLLAAESGLLGLTGEPGRAPLWPAADLCRRLGAWSTLFPVAIARLAPAAAPLPLPAGPAVLRWLTGLDVAAAKHGASLRRQGPRDAAFGPAVPYPSTILPCADGYVQVQAGPADPSLLAVLTGDPRLEDPAVWDAPAAHADLIDDACRAWLAGRPAEEAAGAAQELRQPWVPVLRAVTPTVRREYHDDGDTRGWSTSWRVPVMWRSDFEGLADPPTDVPWLGSLGSCRVVELSLAVAGPMAGGLLAAAGAQVTRLVHPHLEAPGPYDAGKRLVRADLNTDAGRSTLEELLASCDVLLTNLSPRTLRNLGVDYSSLATRQPQVALVSIAAFDPDGSRADWTAFDAGIQAACALADATRYPGGPPLRVAGHPLDGATALWAVAAVLGALARKRQGTVPPQPLTVVMERVGQALMAGAARGQVKPPIFQAVLPCRGADRWLALVVPYVVRWERLQQMTAVQLPPPEDPRVGAVLAAWTGDHDRDVLAAQLRAAGLDAAPVLMPGEW